MEKLRSRSQAGFTLIELLVVIAIIGILAAIAIPQFAAYRRRGYDAGVKSDLKNAATAQEAYFVDHDTYTSVVGDIKGYNQSQNVDMTMVGDATSFTLTGVPIKGCTADGTWILISTTGSITGTPCS